MPADLPGTLHDRVHRDIGRGRPVWTVRARKRLLTKIRQHAQPFIKWAGGKRSIVPELLSETPSRFGVYHEPLVGGGALFFALAAQGRLRNGAVLSDINLRLIRTWRAVRDNVEGVIDRLSYHASMHSKEHYYEVRAWDVDAFKDDADVAGWFIYLNKTGYNGLYRVNSRNQFNVPFGGAKNPAIFNADNLRACAATLAGVQIEHEDFSKVRERARPGDLVYFDPPYAPLSSTAKFTAYTPEGFGPHDQARLAKLAAELADLGVTVILSNHDCDEVRRLYDSRFRIRTIHAARTIGHRFGSRGKTREVIIATKGASNDYAVTRRST